MSIMQSSCFEVFHNEILGRVSFEARNLLAFIPGYIYIWSVLFPHVLKRHDDGIHTERIDIPNVLSFASDSKLIPDQRLCFLQNFSSIYSRQTESS